MAENKQCPVCHAINPPTATVCECGHRFREGDTLSESEVARRARKLKLRAAIGTAAVVAVIAVLVVLTMFFSVRVLFYTLGAIVATLLVAFVVYRIVRFSDKNRRAKK